jgi:hypothetical protein
MILARLLSRQQMLAITDVSASVFDRMINRGGMALTFGVPRAIVRDRYVSTDPVYARAVIEFGRQFHVPQPVVAALVRLDNITVLDGIVRAEAHPELQLGLALIQGAGQMQLVCGTDDELRAFLFGPPHEGRLRRPPRLDQVTVINLTDLILNIRRQAAKKKIDVGVPLFMTPDDPRYQELRRELLEIREADTKTVQKAAAFAALRERITSHVAIQ